MTAAADVIVVGLGAMGSAAAFHLARRGRSVIGLDRFRPPHAQGSSHGETRIIREAYFEDPRYVPLVQRAYELWAELEAATDRALLTLTGGLMIGAPDGLLVGGARRSAQQHRLRHEVLSAAEVGARFPALRPAADLQAVWEPRAGILVPEACIEAHLAQALRHGATLRYHERVLEWRPDGAGLRVITEQGEYRGRQLLLAAGAWLPALLRLDGPVPLAIERQVLYWFAPRAGAAGFGPAQCPVWLWESAPREYFYGFPDLGQGIKIARHHAGETADPDQVRRPAGTAEIEAMRACLRRHVPDADGTLLDTRVCLYTNTPDEHFWIDWHPRHPRVLVASACSGHGFKFSSAIGEALAELLADGRSSSDLELFRGARLTSP